MFTIERKSEIINLLEEHGRVDVCNLAEKFNISKETIRRDLRELEKDGILKRTHGGAVSVSVAVDSPTIGEEYPVSVRGIHRFTEKQYICQKAASYIKDGDTIFVDNSSTTMYLVKYIPTDLHLTFVTNSIKFLLESAQYDCKNHMYICLGGIFKESNLSVYGNATLKNGHEYYPNKAFISCAGISSNRLLTDSSIHEVDTKRMMIDLAQEVFVLADHTKFQTNGPVFLSDFTKINKIITDNKTPPEAYQHLNKENIDIVIAN